MTPLVKEMVALDQEVALLCIWFDLGTLPRYRQPFGSILRGRHTCQPAAARAARSLADLR